MATSIIPLESAFLIHLQETFEEISHTWKLVARFLLPDHYAGVPHLPELLLAKGGLYAATDLSISTLSLSQFHCHHGRLMYAVPYKHIKLVMTNSLYAERVCLYCWVKSFLRLFILMYLAFLSFSWALESESFSYVVSSPWVPLPPACQPLFHLQAIVSKIEVFHLSCYRGPYSL